MRVEFHKLGEVITLPPLGVDEDCLHILSVVLQTDFLNLFNLDHFLKLVKVLRVFVEFTVPQLLLILFFLLSDLSRGLLLRLLRAFLVSEPTQKTLLGVSVLCLLQFVLPLFLFLLLFLPPRHDDGENRLSQVGEESDCRDTLLQERHGVSLSLQNHLALLLGSFRKDLNQLVVILGCATQEPRESLLTASS